MWATGMMDPDSWKYAALNHKWYRDDNAYADCQEGNTAFGFARSVAVHYDGAEGSCIISRLEGGAVSFTPNELPFEIKPVRTLELKGPDGSVKYSVSKIVYEKETLTFNFLRNGSDEEISVVMGIATEGFTTDILGKTEPPVPAASPAAQTGPWICPCGTENIGNFCKDCGHPRV